MSGAQTSTFADPNILYKTLSGAGYQEVEQNRLLNQGRERALAGDDMEMIARAAGALRLLPDEATRAAQYPDVVAQLQRYGVKAGLPPTYPGEAALIRAQAMGTPSADLFKLGIDRQAKGSIAPGDDGTTGTGGTGGGGGSTGTVGGADTAPINAAGDSRTRKASEGGPPAAGSPGAAVAQQVHDFWISKGYSEPQVAGIMAGGPGSESDFTPTVFGDKGTSYGLYQHHGPRLAAMQQFFGLSGSQMPSADQQNQYAHWEITQGPLKNVGERLKTAKTAAEAAAIWTQYFGVPADRSEIGRRAAGAQRFVGLYGGQPGAPGASTAPAVVTGDIGRPGDVPPPPWGAPGAYGGGGMGAVIGQPPTARAAPIPAGRPTGPPVVTDQPAGGGVVAGPPGTAVVGAPQPPSPEVPGNVAAINAGIVRAGGQPAADPYATPARYAGTAPAPSVEAPPETGWGAQVGSGYGPQNALAPAPVPPAATRPAAPAAAQPAAQQPPAADTLPPLPAPTPPAPTNRNGLNAAQQQDIERRRGMTNVSADELQKRVDSYVATNAAVAEKYQQDQIAYVREARERQTTAGAAAHQTLEEQRQAAADAALAEQRRVENVRAEDAARREAAKAVDLTLEGGDDGSARYAAAYAIKAAPITHLDGSTVYPNMTAYDKPTYRGGKGQIAEGGAPDYGAVKTTPPTQMNATQSLAAGFADRMRNALPVISDTSDAAMSRWQVLLGKAPLGNNWVSPEFQQHVQAERDFINAVLRRESGAAISEPEFVNARQQYIPQPGDKPAVLAQKQKNRETVMANLTRDAGPAYKPPATTAAEQQPVSVKTPDDAQSLPPGTVYRTPDGRTFKR